MEGMASVDCYPVECQMIYCNVLVRWCRRARRGRATRPARCWSAWARRWWGWRWRARRWEPWGRRRGASGPRAARTRRAARSTATRALRWCSTRSSRRLRRDSYSDQEVLTLGTFLTAYFTTLYHNLVNFSFIHVHKTGHPNRIAFFPPVKNILVKWLSFFQIRNRKLESNKYIEDTWRK